MPTKGASRYLGMLLTTTLTDTFQMLLYYESHLVFTPSEPNGDAMDNVY